MEKYEVQLQVVSRIHHDMLFLQITSGCDILFESHYALMPEEAPAGWMKGELLKGFEHALDVKMHQVFGD